MRQTYVESSIESEPHFNGSYVLRTFVVQRTGMCATCAQWVQTIRKKVNSTVNRKRSKSCSIIIITEVYI